MTRPFSSHCDLGSFSGRIHVVEAIVVGGAGG